MTISKMQNESKLTLALEGRLDTTTAPELESVLGECFNTTSELVLDFMNLEYISSAGLRVLLGAQKTMNAKSAPMSVTNVSAEIMEIFDMTGFSDILTIV